jgi:hypothetical protein
MSIQVALNHRKFYTFERPIILGPHILRYARSHIVALPLKVIR